MSNLDDAIKKQKQNNEEYEKALQARNDILQRNKDAQAKIDSLKQERASLEPKLVEAQKAGIKLVHDEDKTKEVTTANASQATEDVKKDYDSQKQSLEQTQNAYQAQVDKANKDNSEAQTKIDQVNKTNNDALIQATQKASQVEGITVIQDQDQIQKVDASNIDQASQKNQQDIQAQIDKINTQIQTVQQENEQIKQNNELAKQQYDKEYLAWQKENEAYITKLSQTSGWSVNQIKQFFGDDLSKLTYITSSPNTTVDYGNLKVLSKANLDIIKEKMPVEYHAIVTEQPQYSHLFTFDKGTNWTYKNAFIDSQTGQSVDAKFTVTDYQANPKFKGVPPVLTLKGWQGEPENSMIVDFFPGQTSNVTINIQYFDHNTGKAVKLNPLFGIGDIDGAQMVKVYDAKKALIGKEISELNGDNYLGAVARANWGTTPENREGQGWFILPESNNTTFTFGYQNDGSDSDGIEFGVGNIDTVYQANKPVLNQKNLSTLNLHWHKSIVELNQEQPEPKEFHYHFTDLKLNPDQVPDQPILKESEVHYHNVDLELDPHPLPDPSKTITIVTEHEKKDGSQTIRFVDKKTGKVITVDKVGGKVGENVDVHLKVPDGYHLVEGQTVPTSANIKDKDNPINILVEKDPTPAKPSTPETKDGTQTIHIIDKKTGNVLTTVVKGGKIGENISVSLKVPKGYHLVPGQKLPTSVNIKDKDNAINVYVEKDEAKPAVTTPSNNNNSKATPAPARQATLPQTGNSSSTAGIVAGSTLLATMATLGIAYRKRKN